MPDIFADERIPHDLYRATFVRSLVMMPVASGTGAAAIGAYWSVAAQPDPESITLLGMLARYVSAAMNNVALQDLLEILDDRTGAAIAAERDLAAIVQLVPMLVELTGAEFGAFFYNLIDDRGESYMLYSLSGVPRRRFSKFPMPRNTAVFAPTFSGEAVVRSDNIKLDPRYGHNVRARACRRGICP